MTRTRLLKLKTEFEKHQIFPGPVLSNFQMEMFVSAVLGELATRSVSFFINKYSKKQEQALVVNLERLLLRAQVIVDEAAGRHITNQGMLRKLSMLRDAMYRGFYILDTFKYRAAEDNEDEDHQVVSHSKALSKFNYAKRICLCSSRSTKTSQELEAEEVLDSLRTMIIDVSESVVFLTTYPHLHRQPYSMHFLMEKCMFGRQMEMELVINFLLHTQACSSSSDRFDVLPIVGPGRSGKSTLVFHVCNDKRVRGNFSQIVFFEHGNIKDEDTTIWSDKQTMRHGKKGKFLMVFDTVGELNENLWERLCSLSRSCTTRGSKIIITSRSDRITKLGTTQAMTLKHLSHEAYWYFFKVITFGSTDAEVHPKLMYLAMEIASMLNKSLVAANITARLLRANFGIHFWCNVLKFMRRHVEKHPSMFGEHPCELLDESKPVYLRRLGRASEDLFISDQYQTCSSQEELPEITVQDVMYGGVQPHGIFKVLAWKSQIPPYRCYIYTCEIREQQTRVVKRKRPLNDSCRHG